MNFTDEPAEGRRGPGRPPKAQVDEIPEGHVRVRVMRKGHKRIFTGDTEALNRDEPFPTYAQGDVFAMPRETADKYEEDFGWVEILP